MSSLLNFAQFLSASRKVQTETVSLLFEPCPALQDLIFSHFPLSSKISNFREFIEFVRVILLGLLNSEVLSKNNDLICNIIAAHPRLGAKKVESALSKAEQANLQNSSPDAEKEAQILDSLNKEYELAFPGLRFVVFVNGRGRPDIFHDMRSRISRNDFVLECKDSFNAMCDIALDRSKKLNLISSKL